MTEAIVNLCKRGHDKNDPAIGYTAVYSNNRTYVQCRLCNLENHRRFDQRKQAKLNAHDDLMAALRQIETQTGEPWVRKVARAAIAKGEATT